MYAFVLFLKYGCLLQTPYCGMNLGCISVGSNT